MVVVNDIEYIGNILVVFILFVMVELLMIGVVKFGDLVLLIGYGVGLSYVV